MALSRATVLFLINVSLLLTFTYAADPFAFYNFEVSYITASPLGVPQQVPFFLFFFFSRSVAFCFFWMWVCLLSRTLTLNSLKFQALLADLHHGTRMNSNVTLELEGLCELCECHNKSLTKLVFGRN